MPPEIIQVLYVLMAVGFATSVFVIGSMIFVRTADWLKDEGYIKGEWIPPRGDSLYPTRTRSDRK